MNDFGRVLEKETPRLRRHAFALTRNMSRTDDLVQDTLVRAIARQCYWQWGTNFWPAKDRVDVHDPEKLSLGSRIQKGDHHVIFVIFHSPDCHVRARRALDCDRGTDGRHDAS